MNASPARKTPETDTITAAYTSTVLADKNIHNSPGDNSGAGTFLRHDFLQGTSVAVQSSSAPVQRGADEFEHAGFSHEPPSCALHSGGRITAIPTSSSANWIHAADSPPGDHAHASGDYSAALSAMSDFDSLDLLPSVHPPWVNAQGKVSAAGALASTRLFLPTPEQDICNTNDPCSRMCNG